VKGSSTQQTEFEASFNEVDNMVTMTELDGTLVTYTYDDTDQLLSEARSKGGQSSLISYSYDLLGNRLTKNADGVITTYTYGAGNVLESEVTGSAVTNYSYDGNGNLTLRDVEGALTTYTWDDEDRLIGVLNPNGTSETYEYSADGLRQKKVTPAGTTQFVWDGANVLQELDGAGNLKNHYTQYPGYWGTGGMISQRQVAGGVDASLFYGFDQQSNTRIVTDSNGNIVTKYSYDAGGGEVQEHWGGETSPDPSLQLHYGGQTSVPVTITHYGGQVWPDTPNGGIYNPFQFGGEVGYYQDTEDRSYVRMRHLDLNGQRWISEDPIGLYNSESNLYRYVKNNPINWIDPNGLWGEEIHESCTTAWAKEVYVQVPGQKKQFLTFLNPSDLGFGAGQMDKPSRASLTTPQYPPHFDTWPNPEQDSRESFFQMQRGRALNAAKPPRTVRVGRTARRGRYVNNPCNDLPPCRKALCNFGMGLHGIQDMFSHEDATPAEHADYRNVGYIDYIYARRSSNIGPSDQIFHAGEGAGYGVVEEGLKGGYFYGETVRVWHWVPDPTGSRLIKTKRETQLRLRLFLLALYKANRKCVKIVSSPPPKQPSCFPVRGPFPYIKQPALPSNQDVKKKTSGVIQDIENAIKNAIGAAGF
jgi:RHS repeat-associated protein